MTSETITKNSASFRDPDGFVFETHGEIYRAIHANYVATFNECVSSGLFNTLIYEGLLLPFTHVDAAAFAIPDHPVVIKPRRIDILSYSYEWSVAQWKAAARCTLRVQELSLRYGFHLKDATPFNIQFVDGKPVFIDTLSFYRPSGAAWGAYRQFCECFYAPLLVMTKVEQDLGRLSVLYPNGLPLKIASTLLPLRTWLNSHVLFNIHLHAKSQIDHPNGEHVHARRSSLKVDANYTMRLVTSLQRAIAAVGRGTSIFNWVEYYHENKIDRSYVSSKIDIVSRYLAKALPHQTLDVGTNTGMFARVAAAHSGAVVAVDRDPVSIGQFYAELRKEAGTNILPLVMDIVNPTSSVGWMNAERTSFFDRVQPDMIMLLGISHHFLAQANINFSKLIELCAQSRHYVIVEYIPADDPNYRSMFASREKDFDWYTQDNLIAALKSKFTILDVRKAAPTERTIIFAELTDA